MCWGISRMVMIAWMGFTHRAIDWFLQERLNIKWIERHLLKSRNGHSMWMLFYEILRAERILLKLIQILSRLIRIILRKRNKRLRLKSSFLADFLLCQVAINPLNNKKRNKWNENTESFNYYWYIKVIIKRIIH